MNSIMEQMAKFGIVRLAVLALVAISLLSFFGFIMFQASQPTLSVLYTDLAPEDSSAIITELDAQNIKYELRDEGRTILVQKSEVPRLRLDLASKGVPTSGVVGYEIFDKSDTFSATSFVQNINQLRALEGELARSIKTIGNVQAARVHLVLPERRIFERDKQPPRASIVLKTRGELSAGQIVAIRRLVASAVEGLKSENVSIVDEQGRLLADGTSGADGLSVMFDEKQLNFEKRLREQVESIVASVVGLGRARVQIAAEMDNNKIQQTSETFDPETRVVRSTQNRNEDQTTTEVLDGQVTASQQLPGGQASNTNQRDASTKSEETINYEISKTTRTEMIEGGRVKRLSVAVLVDGTYTRNAEGQVTYQPREQAELERIIAVVKSSIGFDAKRGDQVEVANLRFAEAPEVIPETAEAPWYDPSRLDLNRLSQLGILAFISLIVTFVIGRPLMRALLGGGRSGRSDKMANNEPEMQQLMTNPLDQIGGLVAGNQEISIQTIRKWIAEKN